MKAQRRHEQRLRSVTQGVLRGEFAAERYFQISDLAGTYEGNAIRLRQVLDRQRTGGGGVEVILYMVSGGYAQRELKCLALADRLGSSGPCQGGLDGRQAELQR